jgi:hypothetical protein
MDRSRILQSYKALKKWELLILSVLLSLSLTFLHYMMVDSLNTAFQLKWSTQIMQNNGPYPDQYRILTYYLANLLIWAGVPFAPAFLILRLLFTAASFFILYRYLENWLKPVTALLGLFIMAAVMPITYLFYGMQPADPLNMLVFFLAVWAFAQNRDSWLIPLVVIGMLNRETAMLLPLIFLFLRYGTTPIRYWLPRFIASSTAAAVIYACLRIIYGIKAPYAPTSPLHYWWANLTDWKTWIQLAGFFSIFLLISWQNWKGKPVFLKRLSCILPVFILIHFTVGYMREVRYFLPLLPIILPMALINIEERSE